jgi:putative Flp pilus-assembly TadE/G-like protein
LQQNWVIKLNQRLHTLRDAITRFLRDNRGATAAMVAAALPVLIGFETLGVETGLWYLIKWQSQSAADAAAISAAHELIAGKTDVAGDLATAVSEAAAHNGYTGTAPQIVYPYSDSIVANGVAIYLRRSERVFGSIFMPTVTIASKAVAVLGVLDDVCVLALATTGKGVEVDSASHLDATGCAVAANSTSRNAIDVRSSTGSLSASTLVTQGEISLHGTPIDPIAPPSEFTPTPRLLIGATSIADPYANTLTHAFLSRQIPVTPAAINSWATGATPVVPGLYRGGMLVWPSARIDLQPGVYYVTEGDFAIDSGATVTCTTCNGANGVTIVLARPDASVEAVGNVRIASGASVTLRAPNTGTFAGLLFIQDPLAIPAGGNAPDSVLAGGSGMNLTGLLYFPKTKVRFQGNPGATCTLLIASRVGTDGSAGFAASGCAGAGLSGRPVIYTAALVE